MEKGSLKAFFEGRTSREPVQEARLEEKSKKEKVRERGGKASYHEHEV
ncbi:hypothetical protein NTE_00212 [Candidatus Nitrososphaera evergladensis SR1]|uniref:Uncharacterized protein n=1 Tax=Candidatus Nitrososphaera evergladensis SR1 TaxID=1459636 RepID=A0A075MSH1_9ARCH|nr:hypothetical protein [Candidatus Nitrososphaera evergladensis]AIF82294.1 hypothetical protein NTE_00212 [Candidatus Nitrososphaera evergladensis SR1]